MVVPRGQLSRTIETTKSSSVERKGLKIDDFYVLVILAVGCIIWYYAGNKADNSIILPKFQDTVKAFFEAVTDPFTLTNLGITLRRVLVGSLYSIIVGVPLGLLMGYSKTAYRTLAPLINSIRQIPIMAWVPLSIIWFGLGDGPTIFLIAFAGVFTVIINTIDAVQDIDRNYYNAARSLGANKWHLIKDVVIPGSFPGIFTGTRLAIGSGWMSVICAEFIATSAGFGYCMVEAQTRMQTNVLLALMIISGIVGFLIDKILLFAGERLMRWKV